MKKRVFQIVVIFLVALSLVGCSGGQEKATDSSTSDVCDLSTYKMHAIPVMEKYAGILQLVDINDKDSRASMVERLEALLSEARNVKCKDSYPLKQETLEYSIKHMLDALNYFEQGQIEDAKISLQKSTLNVEAFSDWSMDVGN